MPYFRRIPVYFFGSIVVVAVAISWALLFFSDVSGWPYICIGIGTLGSWIVIWLKKKFAVSGEELYARDPRAPVLYLRSFNDDDKFKANSSGGIYFNNSQMFEESLVRALKKLGPVMAIGRPNEKLPPLGAARMYVGDDGWKDKVAKLIHESNLIVLVLGKTAGLGWEISTVKKFGAWHKTLFVFPPTSEPDLMERWSIFCSLADLQKQGGHGPIKSTVVYATGNPDGSVSLIDHPRVRRKKRTAKYRWSAYASSLRPVLQARTGRA